MKTIPIALAQFYIHSIIEGGVHFGKRKFTSLIIHFSKRDFPVQLAAVGIQWNNLQPFWKERKVQDSNKLSNRFKVKLNFEKSNIFANKIIKILLFAREIISFFSGTILVFFLDGVH